MNYELTNNNMDMYLNLMPDLRNVVLSYFGDVIFSRGDKVGFPCAQFSQSSDFSQAQDEVNEVTFATAKEFKKSKATDCIFINFEIKSADHENHPDIPKTLLRCSGVPKIKTHTLAFMFQSSKFNGDISKWDVSSVTDMYAIFDNSHFNGDLSQWDVSTVKNMGFMFYETQFNNNLHTWDVSSVTNMEGMFSCSQFNKDLSQWDVSSVQNMASMFYGSQFNNNLLTWDVSSVTVMNDMFWDAEFNNNLLTWNVSNVTSMCNMFRNSTFNGDISQWNISSVQELIYMFKASKMDKETVRSWDNFKNHNIDEMF